MRRVRYNLNRGYFDAYDYRDWKIDLCKISFRFPLASGRYCFVALMNNAAELRYIDVEFFFRYESGKSYCTMLRDKSVDYCVRGFKVNREKKKRDGSEREKRKKMNFRFDAIRYCFNVRTDG